MALSNLPEADGGFGLHSPRWPDGLGRPDVRIFGPLATGRVGVVLFCSAGTTRQVAYFLKTCFKTALAYML